MRPAPLVLLVGVLSAAPAASLTLGGTPMIQGVHQSGFGDETYLFPNMMFGLALVPAIPGPPLSYQTAGFAGSDPTLGPSALGISDAQTSVLYQLGGGTLTFLVPDAPTLSQTDNDPWSDNSPALLEIVVYLSWQVSAATTVSFGSSFTLDATIPGAGSVDLFAAACTIPGGTLLDLVVFDGQEQHCNSSLFEDYAFSAPGSGAYPLSLFHTVSAVPGVDYVTAGLLSLQVKNDGGPTWASLNGYGITGAEVPEPAPPLLLAAGLLAWGVAGVQYTPGSMRKRARAQ